VLSIVGFLRARAMRAQMDDLTRTVDALKRHVETLSTRPQAPTPDAPEPSRATATVPLTAPPPLSIKPPAIAGATVSEAPPPLVPPVIRQAPRVTPPPPPPPVSPPPPRQAGPPASPPIPPARPVPAPQPEPTFDWESMLGIRGAAWLGGITLVIAALFFAKWSIDQGFFSPVIRIALLLLAGTAALVWAEVNLRRGYQTTANAVSGAGVVILYVAFYAGHSLYQLIALPVAFAGMSVVTLVAGVIAVRYAAQFTALIGLAGGLATPVLLSTGVDRPVAFFSYLVLLTVGFLYVAERRGWASVTALSLIGSAMLELGWYSSYIAPEKLAVGVTAFAALGAAFLWHAVRVRDADTPLAYQAGLAGSLVPLGFALLLAADRQFALPWPIVMAFLAVVDLGLVSAALRWQQPCSSACRQSPLDCRLSARRRTRFCTGVGPWGPSLVVLARPPPTTCSHASPHAGTRWLEPGSVLRSPGPPRSRLLAFTWVSTDAGRLPVWAFLALTAGALALAIELTRDGHWPGAFGVGTLLIALSCGHWVARMAEPGAYVDHLTIPHLFAVVVAVVVAWRTLQTKEHAADAWWQSDRAARWRGGLAYSSALGGLDGASRPRVSYSRSSGWTWPWRSAWRSNRMGWTVPVAAAASLLFSATWHDRHFGPQPGQRRAYAVGYVLFLALPFLVSRRLAPSWKTRPAPWLVSALIAPASFFLFYDSWVQLWGRAWVGVVPVAMAFISVTALYGVSRDFQPSSNEDEAGRRLNYLALFAAIALGFIATAVPLQLDRQWITIGWALEAAAVWWLFGTLPHPGLKYLGLGLFIAVGVRLLANPEVLRYEPRGRPIVNWLLYTYGVPALCCLAGPTCCGGPSSGVGPSPATTTSRTIGSTPAPWSASSASSSCSG
jgi:hypothetical protein